MPTPSDLLALAIRTIEWTEGFVVDEPGNGPMETWHRGVDGPLAQLRAALATPLPEGAAPSLDAAWKEAEAALPEGAHLSVGGPYRASGETNYHVAAYSAETRTVRGDADIEPYGVHVTVNGADAEFSIWLGAGNGPTLTAALQALAAYLRESLPQPQDKT